MQDTLAVVHTTNHPTINRQFRLCSCYGCSTLTNKPPDSGSTNCTVNPTRCATALLGGGVFVVGVAGEVWAAGELVVFWAAWWAWVAGARVVWVVTGVVTGVVAGVVVGVAGEVVWLSGELGLEHGDAQNDAQQNGEEFHFVLDTQQLNDDVGG
ncbi:unnamed protein product [Bursaphelenchus okinawaensis]|uniref:Uncharacterized protein n=1 Tax=Bursaphelenchus okinawaensis TaxID=465554 RepID=A0A811KQ10_9BILA|nr:unnamed protein product [Bursaphelenchus okinawaensis]CAG9109839.1 unnamed protein product [Bursaphelenchus okinawaensis]